MSTEGDILYNHYAVAFVDVLGQKKVFENLNPRFNLEVQHDLRRRLREGF